MKSLTELDLDIIEMMILVLLSSLTVSASPSRSMWQLQESQRGTI